MENKQIDILDILLIIAKHKKFIFFTTLIVSIGIVIYSLVVPETWESKTVVLPISQQQGFNVEDAIMGQISSSFLKNSSSNNDAIPIIQSRTFLEKIVVKFNIIEYLKIDVEDELIKNYLAIDALRRNIIKIDENTNSGIITITVSSKDKQYSADIANYIVAELDRFNRKERLSKGKENRVFIENRIDEIDNNIAAIRKEVQEFERDNNIIQINSQVEKQIGLYADIIAQLKEKEIEVEYLQKYYSEDSSTLAQALSTKYILEKQIELFENSNSLPKYYINLNDFSNISTNYSAMKFNLLIQSKLYENLYPQYEFARISELKDTPFIQVIDRAIPAAKRSKPRRGFMCILAFIMALVISSCYVIILEIIQNYLKKDSKQDKWNKFKTNLLN